MAGGVDVTGGSNVFERRAKAVCVVKVVFFRTTDKRRATIKAGWQKVRSGFCLKSSENKKMEHDTDRIKTHRALTKQSRLPRLKVGLPRRLRSLQ